MTLEPARLRAPRPAKRAMDFLRKMVHRIPMKTRLARLILAVGAWLVWPAIAPAAAPLQTFTDCRLVEHPGNDGDSFAVQAGERRLNVRLYFVDCPESAVSTDADAKRVREQARHFGIADPVKVLAFGREAAQFTAQALARPFTVHTSFADAMGRTPGGRVYGFVTTADGRDLASLLVEHGFARAHGVRRATPDGTPADEMQKRLADLEQQAMLNRAGIWAAADPNEIARLRALQREEDRELSELRTRLGGGLPEPHSIDLNTATSSQLQAISGIGPVLASAIISNRPYASVDDLLRVKGIGPRLMERIRPYVVVTQNGEPSDSPSQSPE
jgi:competence protein ComEA